MSSLDHTVLKETDLVQEHPSRQRPDAGTSFTRTTSYAYDQTLKLRINDDVPANGNGCFSVRVRIYR